MTVHVRHIFNFVKNILPAIGCYRQLAITNGLLLSLGSAGEAGGRGNRLTTKFSYYDNKKVSKGSQGNCLCQSSTNETAVFTRAKVAIMHQQKRKIQVQI